MAKSETTIFTRDGAGAVLTAPDGVTALEVDLSTDAGVTIAGPVILLGIYVDVVMSAHTVQILDDTAEKILLPASTAVGTNIPCYGAKFTTSLKVTPNASSTGTITLFYKSI